MLKPMNILYHIRLTDELSKRNTGFNTIHPVIQLLTTVAFLLVTVSFDLTEVSGLLPLILYPAVLITVNEIPFKPLLVRIGFAMPFIIAIGILNPIFDNDPYLLGGIIVSRGWMIFISMALRGLLTITAALLLLFSCGMPKLARSMRMLRVPKLIVLQILLMYRYISVLIEEINRTVMAHNLRAPGQKGIGIRAWGSLAGHLILRTFDRAERVYHAMCLRGFDGDYYEKPIKKIDIKDFIYASAWISYFIVVRHFDIPTLIGSLI